MINPMKQIMKAISSSLPSDLAPTNVVSEFVDAEFGKMFPDNEEVNLIKLLVVQFANDDPNTVLNRLVGFSNDVAGFVKRISDVSADVIEDVGETTDSPA